jgi:hypothetical protein
MGGTAADNAGSIAQDASPKVVADMAGSAATPGSDAGVLASAGATNMAAPGRRRTTRVQRRDLCTWG